VTRLRVWVLRALLRWLAATWRIEVVGEEHYEVLRRTGSGFVFALWHRTLVPLLWWHRAQDITLLVSQHADGELVAGSARRLGYRLVRGSSTRGGMRGLLGLVRVLAAGRPAAVTPDGPRGPAGIVKAGVVAAARHAGVPILPVSAGATRVWRLRSWDALDIPWPFARVRIAYAAPLLPHEGGPDLDGCCHVLAERLGEVSSLAGAVA
jgi:lysophospholipid acyltransferase (LPLAT)-like uncharacterized protein